MRERKELIDYGPYLFAAILWNAGDLMETRLLCR